MRNDKMILLDMLLAIQKIERFVDGMEYSQFEASEITQSAVIREFMVIGEAAKLISEETKQAISEIAWPQITAMRNRLVHAYFDIRLKVVWQTIQEDLPVLKQALEEKVGSEEDNQDDLEE